jgi:integrase
LLEALQLRVKDVDFISGEIVVGRGKGQTDRITMLANSAAEELKRQLERVRRQHQKDLVTGGGYVPLPGALHRKSPGSPGSGSGSMSFLPRAGMWMG